ncbi:MAG: PNPLA protein [Magnetococcales bacterium]|nr:PNPLA protein [Magnetococcales bacterium]
MRRKLALNDNRKVNFNDLKIPFVAVATNLTSYSHVIYSKEVTSEQSVTQAVIASSSFPFFFQAKRELANSITDGGLVANLPVSVLLDRQVLPNVESLQLFRPLVVAVHLKDSVESWGPFGKVTLGKKLVSAAMLSNAKLQLLLLKLLPWESCIIEVDVSSVSALDTSVGLDVKENLYNRGKQKALDALPVISGDFNPLRDNTFVKHNRNDSSDEKDRSHRNDYVIIRIVNDFLKKRAGEVSSLAVLSHVVESILGIANDVSVNYLREQIVRGNLWEFSDGIGVSGKGHDLLFELDRRI